jgi:hypothetical protein
MQSLGGGGGAGDSLFNYLKNKKVCSAIKEVQLSRSRRVECTSMPHGTDKQLKLDHEI